MLKEKEATDSALTDTRGKGFQTGTVLTVLSRSVSQSVSQSIKQSINKQWYTFKGCITFPVHLNSFLSGAVHGGWSDFGDWSECSVPCGGGIKERRRTCTSPPPANGGQCCAGDNVEAQSCNTEPCEEKEGRQR